VLSSSCAGSWRWRQCACLVLFCFHSTKRLQASLSVLAGCSETAGRRRLCLSGPTLVSQVLCIIDIHLRRTDLLTFQSNFDPRRCIIILPPHPNEGPFLLRTLALAGQHFAWRPLYHPPHDSPWNCKRLVLSVEHDFIKLNYTVHSKGA
jgi:hypothetical protein